MKRNILAFLVMALVVCASMLFHGAPAAESSTNSTVVTAVTKYMPSSGADILFDHLRNATMTKVTLAKNGTRTGNLNVGGTGELMTYRIGNKLYTWDVDPAVEVDVDAGSGVSWYSYEGASTTFAAIKTVAANTSCAFLFMIDASGGYAIVRGGAVASTAGVPMPPIPSILRKTHAPFAVVKFVNTTGSAVVLGTLALDDSKVTLIPISTALPNEAL